jgi:hypothetical protein
MKDIEHHAAFPNNHDEQRLASPEFAGSAIKGKPMMVISAISTSPTMLYLGLEKQRRFWNPPTSILMGFPSHQRWMNG